jgi:hypothetical protein
VSTDEAANPPTSYELKRDGGHEQVRIVVCVLLCFYLLTRFLFAAIQCDEGHHEFSAQIRVLHCLMGRVLRSVLGCGSRELRLSPSTAGLHANRCVFGHVAACRMQPAVRLHSAYFRGIRSTGLEPRPRPGRGFRAISPAARANRQGQGANGLSSRKIVVDRQGLLTATTMMWRLLAGEFAAVALSSACASFRTNSLWLTAL